MAMPIKKFAEFMNEAPLSQKVSITCETPDSVEAKRILESNFEGNMHIGCVLLATDTPSVDNGDGTYTHTYMTHQLRYIDPRITHTHDDRQAKPL